MARCVYCGEEIDRKSDYRRVEGWERIERPGGGTNALRSRQPLETYACRWCVDKENQGIAPSQASLM